MKTTTFTSNDELQHFLTELYVFLIDEMHANLQKVSSMTFQIGMFESRQLVLLLFYLVYLKGFFRRRFFDCSSPNHGKKVWIADIM